MQDREKLRWGLCMAQASYSQDLSISNHNLHSVAHTTMASFVNFFVIFCCREWKWFALSVSFFSVVFLCFMFCSLQCDVFKRRRKCWKGRVERTFHVNCSKGGGTENRGKRMNVSGRYWTLGPQIAGLGLGIIAVKGLERKSGSHGLDIHLRPLIFFLRSLSHSLCLVFNWNIQPSHVCCFSFAGLQRTNSCCSHLVGYWDDQPEGAIATQCSKSRHACSRSWSHYSPQLFPLR